MGLNPSITSGHSIKFSGSRFIATAAGKVATSLDGQSWTVSAPGSFLAGGAFGNGIYAAVGGASNIGEIHTSPDGVIWTARTPPVTSGFTDVTFGGGLFVAVGHNGKIYTSPDGLSWSSRTSGTSKFLAGVAWGKGAFIASGPQGVLLASPDGTTWTDRSLPTSTDLDVIFTGTEFLSDGRRVVTSPDGIAWTFRTPLPTEAFQDITYGDGRFVAVSQWSNSIIGSTIFTSPDSATWTAQATFPFWLNGVGYANGLFLAGGSNGKILTSPDGVHWTQKVSDGTQTVRRFAYGHGLFVAVAGSYRRAEILTSPDGDRWTVRTPSAVGDELHDIVFADGVFVAVGGYNGNRTLITSFDGINWTARPVIEGTSRTDALRSVAYGGGRFVAIGEWGLIATSTNGTDWRAQAQGNSDSYQPLNDVTFADGVFVATGAFGGELSISWDGANWLRQGSPNPPGIASIAFGAGNFVTVGTGSAILTSTLEPPVPGPVGLTARATSSHRILLGWQDASGDVGYRIERRIEPNEPWSEIAWSLPANSIVFEDSALSPGVTYAYRLRASFGVGGSLYSEPASARTYTVSQQWREDRFGTIANSGSAADSADPDGDGVENLLEIALALDPLQSSQTGLPEASHLETGLRLVFTRDSANTDLIYHVEVSDSLANWTVVARSTTGGSCQAVAQGVHSIYEEPRGGTLIRVAVSVTATAKKHRYLRLRVSRE